MKLVEYQHEIDLCFIKKMKKADDEEKKQLIKDLIEEAEKDPKNWIGYKNEANPDYTHFLAHIIEEKILQYNGEQILVKIFRRAFKDLEGNIERELNARVIGKIVEQYKTENKILKSVCDYNFTDQEKQDLEKIVKNYSSEFAKHTKWKKIHNVYFN